ncbi:MAG: L,D-transpeptidase family protein [Lachnospiraceae bacterium]|jgi:lipoprotein-anchoring transpeptidase ErfK/SrfK
MGKKKHKNSTKYLKNKIKSQKPKTPEEKEMASKINEAMSKIVEDTIGDEIRIEEQELKEKKQKNRKKFRTIAIIAGILLVLLAGVYAGMAYYYANKFFPGTTINHVVCSGLTEEQAEKKIQDEVENYSISIAFRGDKTEEIVGKDIAYSYVPTGEVEQLLESQSPIKWFAGYFHKNDYEVKYSVEYDEGKLLDKMMALQSMQPEQQEAPVDAHIIFDQDQFVLVEESEGNTVDAGILLKKLNEAIAAGETELSAEEAEAYVRPEVYRDDEELLKDLDIYNEYAKASITYLFGDTKEVLDGMTIKDWISYDEEGNPVKDEKALKAHVADYVKDLAKKYNTTDKDRQIKNTATGEMVTVSGGNYGWRINQKEETAQLLKDIQEGNITERAPAFSQEGTTWEEDDIGDTYVEVNLTAQHVWCYEKGNVVWESDCVSGNMRYKDRATPGGTYTVAYKQKNKVLRGKQRPDGTYEYESPVSYWMPFNKGIGFHDATWRGSFGGNIYKTSGSHGCINLPKSKAAELFEHVDKGTIVVVYY